MPILETFKKQPADVQDYDIDFSEWLAGFGDSPISHIVEVEGGITLNSHERADSVVKVWLSGGTDGNTYKVTVRLTTVNGRTYEVEIKVKVKED